MADRKVLRFLRIYLCHYIIILRLGTSDAVCTFPSQFQSSTYEDSYKGTLTFTTNAMTGWTVVAYSNTVTHWQCHIDTSYDASSGGLLVFKATDSISALGTNFYAYLCLNITKVTDNSFYYYQMNGIQANAQNERVLITNDNTLSTVGNTCDASYGGNVAEFKVLLKSGMASTAAQNVSTELFANFDYTYTDASGATACASSSDNWVFCDTRVSMTFNFSTCPQSIAYGTSGIWYHIVTLSLTYKYMVVFNSAASHKFTCFTFTDNTKTTYVYDYCRSGQTNTVLPVVNGSTIGAKLTMTPYTYCPFTTTTTSTTSTTTTSTSTTTTTTTTTTTPTPSTTTGAASGSGNGTSGGASTSSGVSGTVIGGAVAGGLVFIAVLAAALVLLYCLKFKKTGVNPIKPNPKADAPSDNEKLKEAFVNNPALMTELPPKPGLTPINVTQPPSAIQIVPNGVPMNDVKPVQKKPLPSIGKPKK